MPAKKSHKFEWKWLIAGGLFIVALIIAIVANINVTDNSTNKISNSIAIDNSDLKINWERYQTVDIKLTESLNISESGTYHLTGALPEGQITIDAGVSEVRLILDNVTINNPTGPAIICYNAENLIIELIGENILSDGPTYSENYDEDVTGVIYSKADLAFGGTGSLTITSNYKDGVVGKDDVVFRNGTYNINSSDDAIRGKDSVYIVDGDFTINSTGDAIKSTNTDDYGKGFVLVEKGKIVIQSQAKGIKSTNSLLVYNGVINIESYDDAIHSDNYVGLVGGDVTISSGDDGIHANNELIIDGGVLNIIKSYEGIEALVVTINNGEISVISSDDGINAGGGSDETTATEAQKDPFKTDQNASLSINGGNVYVNAGGDGVDSNGYLHFNGGKVIIDGPTNNGNGALDSGLGIDIQGGTVIAIGSSGMAETLGEKSGVSNLSVYFDSIQPAGTKIEIKDSNDNTTLEHTAAKTFSHLAAGSDALIPGETYTIYLNGEEYRTFTISKVTTTIGNGNQNFNQKR